MQIKNILTGKDKTKYKFYFVGIGGVSMFSLAILLKQLNMEVEGTDASVSKNTKTLQKMGIKVNYKHNAQNIVGASVVVYSFAVQNSVEVQKAKELNILTISRATLLGIVVGLYKNSVCVAGAHGKSTTTALIYSTLALEYKNVGLHLGAKLTNGKLNSTFPHLNAIKNNIKSRKCKAKYNLSTNNFFVCEACEYKDAFLCLKPRVAVVLNMAPEHLDYFKNFSNVIKSFKKFASCAKLLICPYNQKFKHKNAVTFGIGKGQFCAKKVKMKKNGTYSFLCYYNKRCLGRFNVNLIGRHNVLNALATIATCYKLGVRIKTIKKGLKTFGGIQRRFEFLNKQKFIVHDYAHHPDEINAVLLETKKFCNKKILVVFQPHTYSRTKTLMDKFVKCLGVADKVAIYRTFGAREKYLKAGSAKKLASKIDGAKYFNNLKTLTQFVLNYIHNNYAVLFLGAGNIYNHAKNINKLC